jgi:hypothetical protein
MLPCYNVRQSAELVTQLYAFRYYVTTYLAFLLSQIIDFKLFLHAVRNSKNTDGRILLKYRNFIKYKKKS